METKLFVTTKAFVVHNGKILILRESNKYQEGTNVGRWDVPGGRIKPGERFDASLIREIEEETGLKVEIKDIFTVDEWRPIVKGEQWQVVGMYFECHADSAEVKLSEDHDKYEWIFPEESEKYNLIPGLSNIFERYIKK